MRIHGSDAEQRQSDTDEIRGLYLATMDGWNRGSGEAFAAPFADEVDFVAFDGTRFRGRDELVQFHDPLFKTHLKGTRLVGDVTDIRFLGSDVAVLHAYGGTVLRGKHEAAPERDSLQTLVAVKRDGRWQFIAFQNTRVRPIGQNLLGTLCWLIGDWFWKWCLPKSHQRPPIASSMSRAIGQPRIHGAEA
jgi:uncharacterized protein (TIGR02246 family)